jgi:hypothetical protein
MGWTGHKLPKPGWFLYTSGGSNDVYIQKKGPNLYKWSMVAIKPLNL